jgi:hypothetical protein
MVLFQSYAIVSLVTCVGTGTYLGTYCYLGSQPNDRNPDPVGDERGYCLMNVPWIAGKKCPKDNKNFSSSMRRGMEEGSSAHLEGVL